jgi:hypothetical protein
MGAAVLSRWGRNRKDRDEGGQATLEFALVALLLFLVLFGIIDFARLFFAYATMANGVREGARYGVVHADPSWDDEIIEHAEAMMILIGGEATVTVERPGGDDPADREGADPPYPVGCTSAYYCRITVKAVSDFDVWTPIIPGFTIVAQATMHFE